MRRLEKLLDQQDGPLPDRCHLFTGRRDLGGYGLLGGEKAHRIAYELHKGPIPSGMYVCHRCDVRACCNPDHLFLGTPKENVQDMMAKGRNKTGPSTPRATRDQIRRMAQNGATLREIAESLRVSPDVACKYGAGLRPHLRSLVRRPQRTCIRPEFMHIPYDVD